MVWVPIQIVTAVQCYITYMLGRDYTKLEQEVTKALFAVSPMPASLSSAQGDTPSQMPVYAPSAQTSASLGWVVATVVALRRGT